jgi:hypothetical protein
MGLISYKRAKRGKEKLEVTSANCRKFNVFAKVGMLERRPEAD